MTVSSQTRIPKPVQSPLVSVVIPTHNRAHTLERAIRSVQAQTYKNRELIVIDDGSNDQTAQLLPKLSTEIPLTQLQTAQRGVSAARNLGIHSARGEWVAFLDSDDEWLAHKLERQAHLSAAQPHLHIIHGDEIWIRNGIRVNQKLKHRKFGGWIFEKCLPLCLISPSAVMIRRSVLLENFFREDFVVCEDYDLWLRLTWQHEVGFVDEPLIIKHGGHDDQLSRRYHAMDLWRVRSIHHLLTTAPLNPTQQRAAVLMLREKCEILLKGYAKHSHPDEQKEVADILTALSVSHPAPDHA